MGALGFEFQPSAEKNFKKDLNKPVGVPGGGGGNPASEVLKILALHMPKVYGGKPIAPADLLQQHMGGGSPLTALLQTLGLGGTPPVTPGSGGSPAPEVGGSPFNPGAPDAPLSVDQFGGGGKPPAPSFTPGGDNGPTAGLPELPTATDPSYGGVKPPDLPTKGGGDPAAGGLPISKGYNNHPLSVMLEHFFPGGKV